jgi:hypothetical protein
MEISANEPPDPHPDPDPDPDPVANPDPLCPPGPPKTSTTRADKRKAKRTVQRVENRAERERQDELGYYIDGQPIASKEDLDDLYITAFDPLCICRRLTDLPSVCVLLPSCDLFCQAQLHDARVNAQLCLVFTESVSGSSGCKDHPTPPFGALIPTVNEKEIKVAETCATKKKSMIKRKNRSRNAKQRRNAKRLERLKRKEELELKEIKKTNPKMTDGDAMDQLLRTKVLEFYGKLGIDAEFDSLEYLYDDIDEWSDT